MCVHGNQGSIEDCSVSSHNLSSRPRVRLLLLHTRSHNQPIRGQKRVTFAYLVSRVTRKKLSSGASIQLGRLLRIMTPPRVFPPPLLRPLCCRKTNKGTKTKTFVYSFDESSSLSSKSRRLTRRDPAVVPGFSARHGQNNQHEQDLFSRFRNKNDQYEVK